MVESGIESKKEMGIIRNIRIGKKILLGWIKRAIKPSWV